MRTDYFTGIQFSNDDKELLGQVAACEECLELSDCSQAKLLEISHTRGLDFATALLFDRILSVPQNLAFYQRVQKASSFGDGLLPVVGIIPGAFYREHKETGADGSTVAEILSSMGYGVETVPVESFGSLKRNATLIAQWLRKQNHRHIVLLSLSKGSADVKTALGLPEAFELFRNVGAWVSLSGLPQGTPLVTWLRRQRLRNLGVRILLGLRGQRYSVVEELRHGFEAPLTDWPILPVHLQVVHVVSFPLRKHLAHRWAPKGFERVAPFGPNDGGGLLLSDAANLPGTIFPVWGADHYLQPVWDATSLLRRVLSAAIAPRQEFLHANQFAAQPIIPPASRSIA